jgi:hypothetical protein
MDKIENIFLPIDIMELAKEFETLTCDLPPDLDAILEQVMR